MRRRPVVALLLLAGAAALVWVWSRGVPPLVERTADQNVLLVTIDTLRADALGSYGGPAATPNLDRLAAGGARFDFAHAHAVVTLPSHASILTGLYPFEHGIHDNAGYRLPEDSLTLAAMLRAEGFATGAFVGAFPLDSQFGLDNGFDVYDDRFGYAEGPSDFTIAERPAEEVVETARTWIESQAGRWFAWVHLFDPHAVYSPRRRLSTHATRRARITARSPTPTTRSVPCSTPPAARVARRSWLSPPTTARRSASTASAPMACSPMRRRCACP